MALKAKLFSHILAPAMVHINNIQTALTSLTSKVTGVVALTDVANVLDSVGGIVTVANGSANTLEIEEGLMVAGDSVTVIQTGAGATSITVSGDVTINGAATPIAVGTQWSSKTITCLATDVYAVH